MATKKNKVKFNICNVHYALITVSEEGEAPDPPFLCYLLPGSDNFSADGKVYHRISEVRLELYTDFKDLPSEQRVETALDAAGIFYNKTETWIDSEKLYEVLYSFDMEGM